MVSSVKDLSLTLYLTFNDKFIDGLIAQEIERIEHLVYYVSKSLRGVELNYLH